jgi:hypothetical protein
MTCTGPRDVVDNRTGKRGYGYHPHGGGRIATNATIQLSPNLAIESHEKSHRQRRFHWSDIENCLRPHLAADLSCSTVHRMSFVSRTRIFAMVWTSLSANEAFEGDRQIDDVVNNWRSDHGTN